MNNKNRSLLSIIMVNRNAKDITIQAFESIEKSYPKEIADGIYQVIIVDNGSSDKSQDAIKAYAKKTKIKKFHAVFNPIGLGFSRGNNAGLPYADGEYILFLNNDTIVNEKVLPYMISFLKEHPDAGAATCKVNLRNGGIDDASHRSFPTPWNAISHFSGLAKLFPHTKLFGSYGMTYVKDMEKTHEIDALAGAFMIMPRTTGEKVGWWDENFFLYGEDIDFCYRIKKAGMKIYYVPEVSIIHLKGTTMGIRKESQDITKASKTSKIESQNARFDSMKIFYKKHYLTKYPNWLTTLIFWQIENMRRKNVNKYR
ncbi:MAG TPA: glycosyltransferase family 2 protein [Candidatus Sulfotelmatobacter sp.]|jgi:GT2 family glycosyltransferase|nr:glycosyltransferase family 2 protein [Candidatus Sulfotelmatobacter sp.]